jgi:hypothetical protein
MKIFVKGGAATTALGADLSAVVRLVRSEMLKEDF